MKIRRINYPLLIGGSIMVLLMILMIFGDNLITYDPYGMQLNTLEMKNGEYVNENPDMPPNKEHLFGTDIVGRDIFSQIIYGAKYTLSLGILVALFRLITALPLALISGFGNKIIGKIIDLFDNIFSTIPTLIFCIIILSFGQINSLEFNQSIIAFIVVLTFVGWARLGKLLRERTKEILNTDFISGEIAIGKNKFLIATQNVLPHLTATIIIETFFEIGRALMLVASMGVFGVYVGDVFYPYELLGKEGSILEASFDPEWGGLLGSSTYALMAKKSWIAFFPALAFFISILGFNLFAEGLKKELNKRNSRFISNLRKIPFHLSPKTFIYQCKNMGRYKGQVILKVIIIIVIVVPLLIPPPSSLYQVDTQKAFSHVQEFDKDKYEGRMLGTVGRDKASEYIINNLKKYGLKSYFKEGYIKEMESNNKIGDIEEVNLSIIDTNGDIIKKLKFKEDYKYTSFHTYSPSYYDEKYSGEILTVKSLEEGKFTNDNKYFLLLDNNKFFGIYDLYDYVEKIEKKVKLAGLIMPEHSNYSYKKKVNLLQVYESNKEEEEQQLYYRGKGTKKPIILEVNRDVLKELKGLEGKNMVSKNDIKILDGFKYKNVAGVIKGKDSSKEKLVIATNYDYLGYDDEIKYKGLLYNGTSISATLEIAKTLVNAKEKPEQDIVFVFFDGSKFRKDTGVDMYLKENGLGFFENSFVISMNSLGLKDTNTLFLDTSVASTNKRKYFEYIKYIEKRAGELGITLKRQHLLDGYEDISRIHTFGGKGMFFSSQNLKSYIEKLQDGLYGMEQKDINVISKEMLKNQIQLILDTIVYICY